MDLKISNIKYNNKMKRKIITLAALLISFQIYCCTTFTFSDSKGNIVFGRNFDFPVGMGHIQINYKNMHKTAFIQVPENPVSWISKYGSITFNQCGREFPYGGMNEAGLVIEQMWLQETEYPKMDKRYGLSELQWIQYQLDNASNVEEVIASDSLVRISFSSIATLHFLISDASGDVATIEYLDGEMVVHRGVDLLYPVLANCTYEHSLKYKESIDNKENIQYNDWTKNSSGRFVDATLLINDYNDDQDIVDYSFLILDSVAQGNGTQWSIVYDITNREIHYKSSQNASLQKIDMKTFDFSCNNTPLFVDMNMDIKGVESFRELTYEDNFNLIESVVLNVDFLKNNMPDGANAASARYAETIKCKGE
jgi:choloylglycine hydrolase